MRDAEVARAVTSVWNQRMGSIPLFEAPVKASERPSLPYATLAVGKDPKTNQQSAVGEIDFRRVAIAVYGSTKDACETAILAIDAAFNDRSPNFTRLPLERGDWMRTEAPQEGSDTITRGEPRMGPEIQPYKGTLIYRVWISRPKGV